MSKNGVKKNLGSLKTNFLSILISPRVDAIPKPYILTSFVTILILVSSGLIVTLLYFLHDERLDASTPLPVSGKAKDDCDALLMRKDFRKSQVFLRPDGQGGEVEEKEFVLSTINFQVLRVDLFQIGFFGLPVEEMTDFLDILDNFSRRFDLEGFEEIPEDNPTLPPLPPLPEPTSPLRILLEELAGELETLTFVIRAEVVEAEELEDIIDIFEDLEDDGLLGELFLSLVMEYEPVEGTTCTLTLQIEDEDSAEGLLDGSCLVLAAEGDEIVDLRYTAVEEVDFVAQLVSFFLNLHSDVPQGDTLQDVFPDSGLVDDKDDVTLLTELLSTANTFCIDRPPLNVVDQFGLISGFGFALEGMITFFLALTLFRGKLGLEKVRAQQKGTRKLSQVDISKVENALGSSMLEMDEEDDEDKVVFDTELKRKMYQQKGEKTISAVDLQRAVFNPRCRKIPHAVTVSTVTFLIFFGLSLLIAAVYQKLEETEVCVSTPLLTASDEVCPVKPIIRLFSFEGEDENDGVLPFGSLGIDFTFVVEAFDELSFEQLEVDSAIVNETRLLCADGAQEEGFCLDNVPGVTIKRKDGGPNPSTVYEFSNEANNLNFELEVESFPGKERLKLFLKSKGNKAETFRVTVNSEIERKGVLNKDFNLTEHTNTVIRIFLDNTLFNADALEEEAELTQVRCCQPQSLNYFEYLGITLGYLAILEGVLTMLVAVFLYFCASLVGKW